MITFFSSDWRLTKHFPHKNFIKNIKSYFHEGVRNDGTKKQDSITIEIRSCLRISRIKATHRWTKYLHQCSLAPYLQVVVLKMARAETWNIKPTYYIRLTAFSSIAWTKLKCSWEIVSKIKRMHKKI